MLTCLINGTVETRLNSDHRLVAFGDGLFETCLADRRGVRFWNDHLNRLENGLARLGMIWTSEDRDALETEIETVLAHVEGVVVCKLILGRGVQGRGYDFDPDRQRTDRIVQVFPYQAQPWHLQGATLVLSEVQASVNPTLAGLKHMNRLDSVLARQSARSAGAHEALLSRADGRLVEGSMSNLYLKRDGQWLTPDLAEAGVDGIIRRRLLRQTEETIRVADLLRSDLDRAEALMISNSLIGLVPVVSLDGRPLTPPAWDELSRFRTAIGLSSD
ncbi:aminodeoxychorismate lyase [Saccharospirillum salsuginis]|uniref:Aminodeoxychorismate lyase n=1 Tax=Saccharospirillum salsuginis TaxID=418750 RepID=A0A918K6D4_9GAMM|nr:aminodeoxychorismate lyase [Saccharospirillum salsuginis]GGX51892.1 4-amino-4-deoxychorismate lyase [Saccharospirillum salsuginis]